MRESRYTPEGLCIETAVNLHELPAFKQGLFTVQDESSMLVALAAEPAPGARVLDVCSAPGGKTTHLAQLMKDSGVIYACDIYQHRLELIGENCKRLGIHNVELCLQDGTKLTERWQDPFDAVLCDVPCSGLGVLGRRADARWSKASENIKGLCYSQYGDTGHPVWLLCGHSHVYAGTLYGESFPGKGGAFVVWRHCVFSADYIAGGV